MADLFLQGFLQCPTSYALQEARYEDLWWFDLCFQNLPHRVQHILNLRPEICRTFHFASWKSVAASMYIKTPQYQACGMNDDCSQEHPSPFAPVEVDWNFHLKTKDPFGSVTSSHAAFCPMSVPEVCIEGLVTHGFSYDLEQEPEVGMMHGLTHGSFLIRRQCGHPGVVFTASNF